MRAPGAAAAIVALAGGAWLAAADPKPAWEVVVPDRVELVAGTPGTFELDVVPGGGRSISRDGPVRIDLVPADGVTITRRRLALADAADPAARAPRFTIKLLAERAGSYPLEVTVRAWLCVRQTCKPVRASKTITVEVPGPAAVDAAPTPPDAAPAPMDARKRRPRRAPAMR